MNDEKFNLDFEKFREIREIDKNCSQFRTSPADYHQWFNLLSDKRLRINEWMTPEERLKATKYEANIMGNFDLAFKSQSNLLYNAIRHYEIFLDRVVDRKYEAKKPRNINR